LREDHATARHLYAIAPGLRRAESIADNSGRQYPQPSAANRQCDQFARDAIEFWVSTMADHVGASAAKLTPVCELIRAHVFAADCIHGDDTTVPALAKVKTRTGGF
jgi:transposase